LCSPSNLGGCKDQSSCNSAGGYWRNSYCYRCSEERFNFSKSGPQSGDTWIFSINKYTGKVDLTKTYPSNDWEPIFLIHVGACGLCRVFDSWSANPQSSWTAQFIPVSVDNQCPLYGLPPLPYTMKVLLRKADGSCVYPGGITIWIDDTPAIGVHYP